MKIIISKEEVKKIAGLSDAWGKAESAFLPKPIQDMLAQKLRDVPDEHLDGAIDMLLEKLHMPQSDFIKNALKKFISEIRRKDGGENILPEQHKQLEQLNRPQLNPAKPMPQLEQLESSSKKTLKISKSQWEEMSKKAQVQQPVQNQALTNAINVVEQQSNTMPLNGQKIRVLLGQIRELVKTDPTIAQ